MAEVKRWLVREHELYKVIESNKVPVSAMWGVWHCSVEIGYLHPRYVELLLPKSYHLPAGGGPVELPR
jgi:hypothetical protein